MTVVGARGTGASCTLSPTLLTRLGASSSLCWATCAARTHSVTSAEELPCRAQVTRGAARASRSHFNGTGKGAREPAARDPRSAQYRLRGPVKGPPGRQVVTELTGTQRLRSRARLLARPALSRSEEAALNKVRRFGARPSTAGWAPYVMISAGLGAGALLLAIAFFLKLA